MIKSNKPRIFKGPASYYAASDETIMEFSSNLLASGGTAVGGLLSLRVVNGKLRIDVYRCDPGQVEVVVGDGVSVWRSGEEKPAIEG